MLLLGLFFYREVVVCHIQIFSCLSFHCGIYRIKSLKLLNLYFQLLVISMSQADISISLTLFRDRDLLTCALYKFMSTHHSL